MKVLNACLCLVVSAIAVLAVSQPAPAVLSDAESSRLLGGAICVVDGTANCPAATPLCKETDCVGDPFTFTDRCPAGTTAKKNAHTSYTQAQFSSSESGKNNHKSDGEIWCIQPVTCTGCHVGLGEFWCKNGANNGAADEQRIKTIPDPASGACSN
jgi:hypothetical protein